MPEFKVNSIEDSANHRKLVRAGFIPSLTDRKGVEFNYDFDWESQNFYRLSRTTPNGKLIYLYIPKTINKHGPNRVIAGKIQLFQHSSCETSCSGPGTIRSRYRRCCSQADGRYAPERRAVDHRPGWTGGLLPYDAPTHRKASPRRRKASTKRRTTTATHKKPRGNK